ncbi:mismatch-specific DNA-glycosylase [Brachybacterium sp. EF45031]|uniref:mismatch-specific DNA-glycosylase n=1 Tax=Brachybacterium sillae TaxID=2810536 RepID=UPI00217E7278|nr:mismatch-specific DNA-glycosylase [Brachybacterium sillae]MCS6711781.1 mismatch-specific DNA-glycosylase [Brachybacterium sillae]
MSASPRAASDHAAGGRAASGRVVSGKADSSLAPGSRPDRAALEAARDREVPDLLPEPLKLLVVGINPGLWTAATGAHFARPGNRFYPALAAAGITPHVIDASTGYRSEDLALLHRLGLGITYLVPRATARADELSAAELHAGGERLVGTVLTHRPVAVAVAGVTSFRQAFGARSTTVGRQEGWPPRALEAAGEHATTLQATPLFVVPNPSGLNAHETVESLGRAYAQAAQAAGLDLHPSR